MSVRNAKYASAPPANPSSSVITESAGHGDRSRFHSRPDTDTRLNAGHPSSEQRAMTSPPASTYMLA